MNTHWSPVTEPDLLTMLQDAESRMEGASAALWQLIRLPKPELWQQHPWADEVCGFWVVAVMGKVCIYYNDRSRGFSSGHFVRWGRIEDYQAGQLSLAERLQHFFSANGSPAEA